MAPEAIAREQMSGTGSVEQTGCTKKDMARCENQELAEETKVAAISSAILTTKRGTGSASTGTILSSAGAHCYLPGTRFLLESGDIVAVEDLQTQ